MDDVNAALRAQQVELAGYVAGADEAALLQPSRCDGWTVADVLLHLAQTNEMAVASVQGRLGEFVDGAAAGLSPTGSIDDWAGALVDAQRTDPSAARDRWIASAEAQSQAFERSDPDARVQWVAGDLAARSLATTRLTESWIHTVDAAVAFGPPPPPTDRLWHTVRLTWRTVPYALGQEGIVAAGPVAFTVAGPDGSPWTFGDAAAATTVITGTALDLCTVAGQRATAAATGLHGTGPDADDVLRLMRTFA
ncbi:maleylpyruvate isomerase family mycothiol-dependent enzyme [Aquihabitans sp. McL0605]|uniref:maleylpyruvate isomerase family mycothiol-dependent enzyme n=1 Tax=Aquihabitans sp. McL0605 TaxID=3415671 RepID=UPI003CE67C15